MNEQKLLYSLVYNHETKEYLVSIHQVLKETASSVHIKSSGTIRAAESFRKHSLATYGLYGSVVQAVHAKRLEATAALNRLAEEALVWEAELDALKSVIPDEPDDEVQTGEEVPEGETREAGHELPDMEMTSGAYAMHEDQCEAGHAVTYANGEGSETPVIPTEPLGVLRGIDVGVSRGVDDVGEPIIPTESPEESRKRRGRR